MNTIVYFHGYGSSAKTDKVDRLKKLYPNAEVLAFDINIDPTISLLEVGEKILMELLNDFNSPGSLYFIGTSLGAWYANELSNGFGCPALLINPCFDPETSLKKYGVAEEVRGKYTVMDLKDVNRKMIVLDLADDVIDHSVLIGKLNAIGGQYVEYPNVGHRFNGPEFENAVKKFIDNM